MSSRGPLVIRIDAVSLDGHRNEPTVEVAFRPWGWKRFVVTG